MLLFLDLWLHCEVLKAGTKSYFFVLSQSTVPIHLRAKRVGLETFTPFSSPFSFTKCIGLPHCVLFTTIEVWSPQWWRGKSSGDIVYCDWSDWPHVPPLEQNVVPHHRFQVPKLTVCGGCPPPRKVPSSHNFALTRKKETDFRQSSTATLGITHEGRRKEVGSWSVAIWCGAEKGLSLGEQESLPFSVKNTKPSHKYENYSWKLWLRGCVSGAGNKLEVIFILKSKHLHREGSWPWLEVGQIADL